MNNQKIFSENKILFLLSPALLDSILIYFITGDAMGWGGGGVMLNRIIAILFLLSPLLVIVLYIYKNFCKYKLNFILFFISWGVNLYYLIAIGNKLLVIGSLIITFLFQLYLVYNIDEIEESD